MATVIVGFYNFGLATPPGPSGRIRQISSSGSTPTVDGAPTLNNLSTDPIGFYFNGGNSTGIRVMVVEREYDPMTFDQLPCNITVYDPASSWAVTVARTTYAFPSSVDLLNVYNISSPADPAGQLFGADYSTGRVFRFTHAKPGMTETLTLEADFYEFTATGQDASAYSVDTVYTTEEVNETEVNYLYAVAQQYKVINSGFDPSDYTYYDSIIVKLDPTDLTTVIDGPEDSLAPNIFDLQFSTYDSTLYATALGGPQWNDDPIKWNEASRIQKINPANLAAPINLVRPANSTETGPTYDDDRFDIRSLAIFSNGTVYILTGSYDDNYDLSGRLWKTTTTAINSLASGTGGLLSSLVPASASIVETLSAVPGSLWAVLPDNAISMIWGMMGNELGVYDATGLVGSPIDAEDGSGWTTGTPAFNSITLATPALHRPKAAAAAPASVKSVRGYVHPLLVSRAGVKPEDFENFVKAFVGKSK